ncbi:asparagine synthetase domain-containing protein 1 [Anabrus simplex]|uniref:asparagine synthetase domain-containing protein 1 n=1 Tax=Anabrus simplex TaxID=316456 RepID=UPI0035A28878
MCGIFVYLVRCPHDPMNERTISASTWQSLLQRGPDYHSVICLESLCEWKFLFAGTVLWMQGEVLEKQPLIDDSGNSLLWNGDIFEGPLVTEGMSDTASLLKALNKSADNNQSILDVLASVRGPFTFVYWNSLSQKMWFGRDRLGRHSLLWHMKGSEQLVLTSVGEKEIAYDEVPAIGIFMISFTNNGERNLVLFPWTDVPEDSVAYAQANSAVPFSIENSRIQSPINLYKRLTDFEPSEQYVAIMSSCRKSNMACDVFKNLLCHKFIQNRVEELICKLKQSVKVRCKTQPGICSGCLSVKWQHSKVNQCASEDGSTSKIRCVAVSSKCCSDLIRTDLPICHHPKVGVLFSGGLDSTVIAALTHEFVPSEEPIDLFNVAFEHTRDNIQSRKTRKETGGFSVPGADYFNVPDRQTGLQSYEELKRIFPNRRWNFVKIDVGKDELEQYRTKTIADLIHPLNTILDDSLGCALWFASRKQGVVNDELYKSPVRILLLGMGADEQLGGYSRHRNLLSSGGWQALSDGLWLDVARLSSRNLGRDDRVLSSHGCQGRFPFLDEEVISYLCSLSPWERCYPTPDFPRGTGDKLLLRLAAWSLGLQKAASFPKRAFQFGSRIANSKEKGSDVSSRLKN